MRGPINQIPKPPTATPAEINQSSGGGTEKKENAAAPATPTHNATANDKPILGFFFFEILSCKPRGSAVNILK